MFTRNIVPMVTQTITSARDLVPRVANRLALWRAPAPPKPTIPLNPTIGQADLDYIELKGWALKWDGSALFENEEEQASDILTRLASNKT